MKMCGISVFKLNKKVRNSPLSSRQSFCLFFPINAIVKGLLETSPRTIKCIISLPHLSGSKDNGSEASKKAVFFKDNGSGFRSEWEQPNF